MALLLGIGCSRATRATLLVLLTVHWFTDVVGLALGWGWSALCAAAFGRTLVAPAGRVETAARAGEAPPPGKMCR